MKSHLRYFLRAGILLGAVHLAMAQDETVNGNLFATGNLDINGNTASFGTSGANPGYSLIYTDGSPATIDFSASVSGVNWLWHQGTSSPQLKLSNSNVLTLFNPATGTAALTLTPAGLTTFAVPAAGGVTTELLRLQATGTNASGTAQRISGQTDVLSGYLDFNRFATSGPATGLTLGTLGGDVLTIRSGGAGEAGNVGIGTATPTAKLDVTGNVKITGSLSATGSLTAPSVTLPDGSTLTSAKATTLYNSAGQAVAAVAADGKVNFTNGLSVGTDPGATITANSAAYLNQTLTNLGFRENPVDPMPVSSIDVSGGNIIGITAIGGYTYVVGEYVGSVKVAGVQLTSYNEYNDNSSFVAKIAPNGVAQWVRSVAGNYYVQLNSVAVDAEGNVVVVGNFGGDVAGLDVAAGMSVTGAQDGLIVKFNSSGIAQWAKAFDAGPSAEFGWNRLDWASVAIDTTGNIIVAGDFSEGAITSSGTTLPCAGGTDGVLAKFSPAGDLQWAKVVGGVTYDVLYSVAVDSAGNVAAVGLCNSSITTLGSTILGAGSADGVVVKLNPAGDLQWAKIVGGTLGDFLYSVAVDASGNIVAAGSSAGNITTLGSAANGLAAGGLIVKFNASGEVQWTDVIGEPFSAVAVDAAGDVVAAGYLRGSITGLGTAISSAGGADGLILKLSGVSGDLSGAISFGGEGDETVRSIAVDNAGIWFRGYSSGSSNYSVGNHTMLGSGSFALRIPSIGIPVSRGVPSSLAWGGGSAINNGVALGSGAYAAGSGSAAVGNGASSAANAFASGSGLATGVAATAMGQLTTAQGPSSTAMGQRTNATGTASTAMGQWASAAGDYSTAMGLGANAQGDSSMAMGQRTNAQGASSTAMGQETNATGTASTAMGQWTNAVGTASTAMGQETNATGTASTAMGQWASAAGDSSTAMGQRTNAVGTASMAMGQWTYATGTASMAMGQEANAQGDYSTAMGQGTNARGIASTAMGQGSDAEGNGSAAMGVNTYASGYAVTAIGRGNIPQGNPTEWVATDDLFVVGNGITYYNSPSNAFSVKKNGETYVSGNLGVGTSAPGSKLTVIGSGTLDTGGSSDRGQQVVFAGPNKTISNGTNAGQVGVFSNSTGPVIDAGGSIAFGAVFNTSNQMAMSAAIKSGRDNATNGNYGGYLSLYTRANGSVATERMRITSSGNVGIGIIAPAEKLDVAGNAKISGTLTVGGQSVATANQLSGYATTTQLAAYQPASGSGSGLTNLNGSAISTGTIPVGRLPVIALDTAATSGNLAWGRVDKSGAGLSDLPNRNYADLQNKPTTLAGYGITDGVQQNANGDVTVTGVTTLRGNVVVGNSAVIRISPAGDLSMGTFAAGPNPSSP